MATFTTFAMQTAETAMSSPPRTAAVLDYLCLFTHDIRRKQKRWQDGRLKFHTFNKRLMVYDEQGNFIGDMHWRAGGDFEEGEEIQLERGGVIVQVAECVGRREQDLSELLDKRAKEKEQRQASAASRPCPLSNPQSISRAPPVDHSQLLHRPLHELIGSPSGHHGRAALPVESPYEERHSGQNPDNRDAHQAKRRRQHSPPPSKKGYAQNLFGATLNLRNDLHRIGHDLPA
ncbi:Protein ZGRF1 [Pleurostoma richardsiae]|uniref:Protein ZGRF1 n=1 Tax=Pleurostoma richardsiae TaxID=41990 RepID=A0AA38VH17_9PEZI|nr:Protein ZGRF1 [Pleurostoma richardsiae]